MRPGSSSSRPSSTAGGDSIAPITAGGDSLATQIRTENKNRFAKFALETLHLSTIFEKEADMKRAALANVPGGQNEVAFQLAATMYEKKFKDKTIRWDNGTAAVDVLRRGEFVFGEFLADDIPRPLHVGGDSTLVTHTGGKFAMQDVDPDGTGKHFAQQWSERYLLHRGKIKNITVSVVSAARLPDMVRHFKALLEDYKKMLEAGRTAGVPAVTSRESTQVGTTEKMYEHGGNR